VDEQWATGPRAIIVDLSQVRAVRTEGLSVLVGLAVRAGEADLGLCLVDGERRLLVRRLEEAGLPDLFEYMPLSTTLWQAFGPSRWASRRHPAS
jgi:anti-anti-sigma regulatory factor